MDKYLETNLLKAMLPQLQAKGPKNLEETAEAT
jgi:hypothetical protein